MNDHLDHISSNSPQDREMNIRVRVTRTIWGCATGMLGISIPLVGITESPLIPIAVIAGAALGTTAVWMGKGLKEPQAPTPAIDLNQLKEIEERLASLETIDLLERRLMERERAGMAIETRNTEVLTPTQEAVTRPQPEMRQNQVT